MTSSALPPTGSRPWAPWAGALLAGSAAVLLAFWAASSTGPALVKFGPHDADYVRGFRAEPEREGATWFHWTSPAASVNLPFHLRGEGWTLRLKMRRHFIEPAHVRLIVEAKIVAQFDLQAEPDQAYRTLDVSLPPLAGGSPFTLRIEAPSENPRPLGLALDFVALARRGQGSVGVSISLLALVFLVGLAAFGAPRWAGAPFVFCTAHAAVVVALVAWALHSDIVAAERVLRLGGGPYVALAAAVALLLRRPRLKAALGIEGGGVAGGLVGVALLGLAAHLALLLHPEYLCPDARIHGEFAWLLARRGPSTFLDHFIEHQFQLSLGLQRVGDHWYALPYPPLFYVLCQPLIRLFHYRPDAATAVLASAVQSLEALLAFGLARRLAGSTSLALGVAAAYPLLPIFTVRLSLAYFPDVTGHAFDLLALLFLAARSDEIGRPRTAAGLAGLLTLAFLAYTQSLLNFGLFLGVFCLLEIASDRSGRTLRRLAGLVGAGLAALALSCLLFYARYGPGLLAMERGQPQAEEHVLLEKLEHQRSPEEAPAAEAADKDPFFGPGFDLLRGLRKAAWRGYVFYGAFAPVALLGLFWLLRKSAAGSARFLLAWGLVYGIMNLGAGALPSPNLFRYTKDMEFVAPLACSGLALVGLALAARRRLWGLLYAGSFLAYEIWRYFAAFPGRTNAAV